ncbi:MAG TPA: acetyl-CoA acetyltransferase [Deltaproteobacteria bacterium]|nr:acetyl-CoA acetyltransferase [Deltaproteobacteria bacterium]
MAKFKNAAIVGIGFTEYSKNSERSVLSLAVESCQNAMKDAGLSPQDVDGILEFNVNDSVATDGVATGLNIPVLNYALDWHAGGFAPSSLVMSASMAVEDGLCKAVLVYRAMNGRSGFRLGGGAGGEAFRAIHAAQYRIPYGWLTYGQHMAMACRRHMEIYGTKSEHLGAIAINQRSNAELNERAVYRKPLTLDEYMSSRLIAEPFHLYDMCSETDGGCALLITSSDRAKDCRKKPVYIKAAGYMGEKGAGSSGDPLWIDSFLWPDLTENFTGPLFSKLYKEAGVGPEDVDVAEIYDCFTYTVLMGLEGLGFCPKGEGGPFAASGAIGLKGSIPINTNGGMLSEAYIHGINVIAEAVMQLRGEGGVRQVSNAEVAAVTSGATTMGSGLILTT